MAGATILQELVQLRADIDEMREEHVDHLIAQEAAHSARDRVREDGVRVRTLIAREAERFMPGTWTGEENACPFSDFAREVERYLSVLDPRGSGKELMEWAAALTEPIS
eukprot:6826398-Heterocapsa_arctica.AAC.1